MATFEKENESVSLNSNFNLIYRILLITVLHIFFELKMASKSLSSRYLAKNVIIVLGNINKTIYTICIHKERPTISKTLGKFLLLFSNFFVLLLLYRLSIHKRTYIGTFI